MIPAYCECGVSIGASHLEAIWSGKKDPYYRVVCTCGKVGPAAVTKAQALEKWSAYRAQLKEKT